MMHEGQTTTPNRTLSGGGAGSALGVILVVMAPKFSEIVFTVEEASIMTAALGTIFAWLVRYIPQPRP